MLVIYENNSFNSIPKEVDIDTTSNFNVGHKKIVEHFLNKQMLSKDAPTVTIKYKNNVRDTMNNKDVICENKEQSILIEKVG